MSRARSTTTNNDRLRCVFCSGVKCKRCGELAYLQQPPEQRAFKKFNSTWITEYVMGMQRPSDLLFDGGLLQQFRESRIVAVFNLTQKGEHPYCGYGIIPATGFSYSPEKLMNAGIKHFNYSWPDMTVPTMSVMRDIVNVARCELYGKNKIAVHCHAGFGRTGIVIACILIACQGLTADIAIELVRVRRPGSVQTSRQELFVREFEAYHGMMLTVFDDIVGKEMKSPEPSASSIKIPLIVPNKTIAEAVRDQAYTLPVGELAATPDLRSLHKIVYSASKGFRKYAVSYPQETFTALTGLAIQDSYDAGDVASPRLETMTQRQPFAPTPQLNLEHPNLPLLRTDSDASPRSGHPTKAVTSDGYEFIISSRTHHKLCSKMKLEANNNKWMLVDTAVDMMTHAHINTEPLNSFGPGGRKRQSFTNKYYSGYGASADANARWDGQLSPSISAVLVDEEEAPPGDSTSTATAPTATPPAETSRPRANTNTVRFAMDQENTNSSTAQGRSSARDRTNMDGGRGTTSARSRNTADDEVVNCTNALAQCLMDWMDCRADVIFNEKTLLAAHKTWCNVFHQIKSSSNKKAHDNKNGGTIGEVAAKKNVLATESNDTYDQNGIGSAAAAVAAAAGDDLSLSLSTKYSVTDSSKFANVSSPLSADPQDMSYNNVTVRAGEESSRNEQSDAQQKSRGVTFADSLISAVMGTNASTNGNNTSNNGNSSSNGHHSSQLQIFEDMNAEESIQAFIEKELATIATPAEITSELEKTFDFIESTSSKKMEPSPGKEVLSRNSALASLLTSKSPSVPAFAGVAGDVNRADGTSVDWDQLSLYNEVFATVEKQLDRYQLQVVNVLVQIVGRLRIGIMGGEGSQSMANANDWTPLNSTRTANASLANTPSKQALSSPSSSSIANGYKMYLLAAFRVAIALTQPNRILLGDYLMTDTSLSPQVAAVFDDASFRVGFESSFQDRLYFVEQVRQRVGDMARERASQFAKFVGSEMDSGGIVRRMYSNSSSSGPSSTGPNSLGSTSASASTDAFGIIRRTSNRISGLINSLDIVTPRLRSISTGSNPFMTSNGNGTGSGSGSGSMETSVSLASGQRSSLTSLSEGHNEALSEKGPPSSAAAEETTNNSNGSSNNATNGEALLNMRLSTPAPAQMSPKTPRSRKKFFGGDSSSRIPNPNSNANPSQSQMNNAPSPNSDSSPATMPRPSMLGESANNTAPLQAAPDSPDVRELEDLVLILVNRAFFVLNILMLLVENQWSYTGPNKNRLRLRSSQSGEHL